jgi:UMF1 family MFS transporter
LIDAGVVIKASFIIVALWWGVFSLPLWWSLDEPGTAPSMSTTQMVSAGWIQLSATFRQVRERRTVWVFLCAYWLYIDGVDTVVRMAVDYGLSLGFESNDLIAALLLTQLVGVPATLLWGRVARVTGAKNGILLGLAIYVLITLLASRITQVWEFFAIAAMIGVAQGGVQALSRSYYAGLIPADASAEFFGFYNLLGKFAAVIGPLLMGWVGVISGDPRLGMLSLLVLFVSGGWLLQWNKVS